HPGDSPVKASDVGTSKRYGTYQDMSGNIGIIGTPVIDTSTDTLYVVARTESPQRVSVQRLHALSIATGAELPGWPIVIGASVPGSNESGPTTINFLPERQNQRAALVFWRPPSGTSGNPVV